jgi:hypothetical protein
MDIGFLVVGPSGALNLNSGVYRLAGDSFASESVSHRKTEVVNPYVEGSFVVNALRENITTPVSVWVTGSSRAELLAGVRALCAVFDQVAFSAQLVIDGVTQVWSCFASDYTVTAQREFLHALRARVDVQLVRAPGEEVL